MCDAAAAALKVPEESRPAFAELYEALSEARGGRAPPSQSDLVAWQATLSGVRAVVEVRAYAAAHKEEVGAIVNSLAEAGVAPRPRLEMLVEQRLIFMGVYGKGADGRVLALDDAFARVKCELQQSLEAGTMASGGFLLQPGKFDQRHAEVQKLAYPYRPSVSAGIGTNVLECICTADGTTVAGYIAMQGDYVDDVAVNPRFHGRGVAKALVSGAATQLVKKGKGSMSLDARACNLPAFEMYKFLGFRVDEKYYPAFFDWHGGYSLHAKSADVAANLPKKGFDVTKLG